MELSQSNTGGAIEPFTVSVSKRRNSDFQRVHLTNVSAPLDTTSVCTPPAPRSALLYTVSIAS